MLKLKLQYFGPLMQRVDLMDMGLGGLWELVMDSEAGVLQFMGSQRVGHD